MVVKNLFYLLSNACKFLKTCPIQKGFVIFGQIEEVETEYQNLRQGLKMLKNATIMNDLFNFRTRNKQIIHFRFTKDYLDHFHLHYGPSVSIFQTS